MSQGQDIRVTIWVTNSHVSIYVSHEHTHTQTQGILTLRRMVTASPSRNYVGHDLRVTNSRVSIWDTYHAHTHTPSRESDAVIHIYIDIHMCIYIYVYIYTVVIYESWNIYMSIWVMNYKSRTRMHLYESRTHTQTRRILRRWRIGHE